MDERCIGEKYIFIVLEEKWDIFYNIRIRKGFLDIKSINYNIYIGNY